MVVRKTGAALRLTKSPGASVRMERTRARTREDILRAAARTFARDGFDASMHAIAHEAGYAAASLYSYFPSKDDIVGALGSALREEFLETFDRRGSSSLSFEERLTQLVRRQLELADARRDEFAVFFAMPANGQEASARPIAPLVTGFEVFLERMTAWLPPDVAEAECGDVACVLVGTLYAFFRRWLAGPPDAHLADQVPRAVALLVAATTPFTLKPTRSAGKPHARI